MKLGAKVSYFLKYVLPKPRRAYNLFLVKLSKFFKLPKVLGLPLTIMVEPASFCNIKCPLCPTGAGLIKRKPLMSFKNFRKIIDEVGDTAIHLRLWNWGEPLLNKEIYKMIKYAKKKKIFVNTSTNSFFINKENAKQIVDSGLDEIIISLDGASEESYRKYRRRGSFKKVIEALKILVEEKKKKRRKSPIIKIQFIVMKHNEHEMKKIMEIAKEIGVDSLFFKSIGTMDREVEEDIKKYLPSKKFSRKKQEIKNMCDIIWEEITINTDGSVVPCCHDAHNKYIFGNAFKENIKKAWNNKRYTHFRKQILKNKKAIPLCISCPGNNKEVKIAEIKLNSYR